LVLAALRAAADRADGPRRRAADSACKCEWVTDTGGSPCCSAAKDGAWMPNGHTDSTGKRGSGCAGNARSGDAMRWPDRSAAGVPRLGGGAV